ncbi:efflux RND transporter periplasmic adaptor subunit [Bacteroidales bacterium OttesenSCG-928-M06]|nr:efflux RND transporter periplasmic adaptor subunit [Bacteroidales bacterium OttesenSCG-928-M06]
MLLVFACNPTKEKDLPVYLVVNQDFENAIFVDGTVEPVNTVIAACPPDVEGTVSYIVEDGTFVEEGDTVCVIEMQELVSDYEEVSAYLEDRKAHLEKVKADLELQYAVLDAQVKNNEAEAQIALLDSVALKFASPNQRRINELELRKVTLEKDKLQKKLDALAVINQTEIRRVEVEIQRLTNRVKTIRERMDALTVKAPRKGLAIRSNYRRSKNKLQVGDIVWHLMSLVSIPDLDTMKVKMQATEFDYKLMNVNDSVVFTFDAMPGNEAWGEIRKKSPVGQQYKEDSKVKFFEIEASVDSSLILPEAGLTATCKIILSQVKDTIVVPRIAINEVDSMKVVYVRLNKGYEMRQVETGLSSQKEVIVTSGLKRGEEVALIKPEQGSVKVTVRLPVALVDEKEGGGSQEENAADKNEIPLENKIQSINIQDKE